MMSSRRKLHSHPTIDYWRVVNRTSICTKWFKLSPMTAAATLSLLHHRYVHGSTQQQARQSSSNQHWRQVWQTTTASLSIREIQNTNAADNNAAVTMLSSRATTSPDNNGHCKPSTLQRLLPKSRIVNDYLPSYRLYLVANVANNFSRRNSFLQLNERRARFVCRK